MSSKKQNKPKKPVPVEKVANIPSLFTSRLAVDSIKIQETTFDIKALSSSQVEYAMGQSYKSGNRMDMPVYISWCLRFGIVGWSNLVDENGNDVKFEAVSIDIRGVKYPAVLVKLLDGDGETGGLNPFVKTALGTLISKLSGLSIEEINKLDFT